MALPRRGGGVTIACDKVSVDMEHNAWPLLDRVFHLADAENWPSIRCAGLHSTTALIERAGLSEQDAQPFHAYRSRGMRLPSGVLIRDQRPMPPSALVRCLDAGISPEVWYRLVNSKVFFWQHIERLNRHLAACGGRPQIVIVVDSRRLLKRYGHSAFVTPFNVGNARRRPAPRGNRTFVPLDVWLATRWESEAKPGCSARSRNHPPVEIAIEGSVPDLMDSVIEVVPIEPGQSYLDT